MLRRFSPVVLLCSALAACSGGGSSGPAAVPHAPGGTVTESVKLSIRIPALSSTASLGRRPLYVSKNTGSLSVAVNAGKAVVTNVSAGSANCVPVSGDNRTCTVAVTAPAGTDSFAVALYQSTDGSGAVLSQSTLSAAVTAGAPNELTIALGGVVASIALSLATTNPPSGTPATIALTANLKDASGAFIVGNDPFVSPVTLTSSDASGATTILPGTILKSPADASGLSVAYTGAAALTQAVFSATASGVPAASISTATLTPQKQTTDASAIVDWPTYGYDSARTGFNPSTTALTPAAVSQLHLAWHISNGGGAQTQPVVATNVAGHQALVIVGGYPKVQAYDGFTGNLVWSTTLQTQNYQDCGTAGLGGTVQYVRGLNAVFIAGGNGGNPNHVIVTRLDATSGSISGTVDVTPTLLTGESAAVHTAMNYANGKLYVGTGSNCEGSTSGLNSWRGRVASIDPSGMTLINTFFTTYGHGGNYGGGGIWTWGGVSIDSGGSVYVGTGNTETNAAAGSLGIRPPFQATDNEAAGFGDQLVKISGDLTTAQDSNYPGFNFSLGGNDLDYAGTPVLYEPTGCGLLSATQGKGGTLVINNTQRLSPAVSSFALSVPSGAAYYVGNPGYSPNTGYLYAAITSAGGGSSMLPPGLAAIGDCGTSITWHTSFGPDSVSYGPNAHVQRSAPTATAGGVVFMGTPCTSDGNGGCATAGKINGAVWAVNAVSGDLLGGGKPIFVTNGNIRMAPTADGQWLWVFDVTGNLYALTVDPLIKAIPSAALRAPNSAQAPIVRYPQ